MFNSIYSKLTFEFLINIVNNININVPKRYIENHKLNKSNVKNTSTKSVSKFNKNNPNNCIMNIVI